MLYPRGFEYEDAATRIIRKNLSDKKQRCPVVKLPCPCRTSVEITRLADQWIQCPQCFKAFFLAYSLKPRFTSKADPTK